MQILVKLSALYLKLCNPTGLLHLWQKIEQLFLFPRNRFDQPLAAIFQVNWGNHYNFFYRLWQTPVLKKSKDWWVVFWNFVSGLKSQFQSIPVMVFYTRDQQELCHWIERPELADKEQAQIAADVKKANPGASEQEIRTKMRERTGAKQPDWQQESIREWRQMLAKKLGV